MAVKTKNELKRWRIWTTRSLAFQIQSRARALGLHADVMNQDQVARLVAVLGEDELPCCPPSLTAATGYARAAVVLTVECRNSQMNDVFGL